jgi:hypothetical protein
MLYALIIALTIGILPTRTPKPNPRPVVTCHGCGFPHRMP